MRQRIREESEAEDQGVVETSEGGEGGKRPARSGRVAVATYNIRDGRAAGLLSATQVFDHANVDLAVVQEVKLKHPKFAPRTGFGYQTTRRRWGPIIAGGSLF